MRRSRPRFDLHIHTSRSDGKFVPERVLERCADAGLDVVALTDHDLSTAVTPGPYRVGERELRVIAGAEVSGFHKDREYHLLVYFPGNVPDGFRDFCIGRARQRARRYDTAVTRIGLDLPSADTAAIAGEHSLTRLHLARALVDGGHAKNLREAFARWVDHAHGNVPPVDLAFLEAIRVARSHGGLTSWAHPPLAAIKTCLPTFVEAGLQGLEAYRPRQKRRDQKTIVAAARRYGLFVTGGSDWHGWHDDDLGLFHVGADQLHEFVTTLRAAA